MDYNPKYWLFFILHSYSREIMKRLLPGMLIIASYTGIIAFLFDLGHIEFESTTAVHSILGVVLGFFLVFRTNGAYDRWWEGRKIWGQLVNNSRNLALKLTAMVPLDHPKFDILREAICNYPKALKEHLRDGVPPRHKDKIEEKLEIKIRDLKEMNHVPNAIAKKLIKTVNELKKEGIIDGEQYRVVNSEIQALTDITGMCERIKNTPIPYSYIMFMKKFIFTYMLTLPFAFVTHFAYWTVGIVVLLMYILLSIELLAEEIEDPFGRDVNDLPTDKLAIKIDTDVREIMR